MLRRMLLAASTSHRVRQVITTAPYTRDVVARFVAGETADDALRATRRLLADGLLVSLDYLGEDTADREQAAAVAEEYIRLLTRLGSAGLASGGRAEVSVKPTAVGLGLPEHGEKTAAENIARICAAASDAGTTVTLDMEDHTSVGPTLRIAAELRLDFPDLGCVIQSYLRRSADDCADLAVAGSRVRLCKGAYRAPDGVAFIPRADVDRSYARCLRILLAGDGYPMLATHDPRLIKIAGVRAAAAGRAPDTFEYQMLYGIRPGEQLRLAGSGARMRVYVPYGSDWYGYLVRRLAERPANLAFFLRSLVSTG
ncbi:MAG TPA: proline dehydrogenase family protein [Streptosporangiaceae bacterium]|nr:proline dehydrogenase family protein [Streptosporangiaceae bacterium]